MREGEYGEPSDFENSMTEAEAACFQFLCELLGYEPQVDAFISVRARGALDCMVFDIGGMATGDVTTFRAEQYHWRGSADFYNRDRTLLQRMLMRLVERLPIAPQYEKAHALLEESNVCHFRIAPVENGIGSIETKEIETYAGGAKTAVFCSTVQFDIVFSAGDRA